MYYYLSAVNLILIVGKLSALDNDTKASIGFPEIEENESLKNKDNRQPVYLPSVCEVNELYYPGDQKDDWICDCRPAFLYHPISDACWPAYQRGPCADGEYLILPKDSVIPICVRNPCVSDAYVMFKGKCERLGSIASCSNLFPVVAAVGVNARTLEVDCERINLETRFNDKGSVVQGTNLCKPGSKTSVIGKCNH